MSQEKVNRYKEEKKNRKSILRREKTKRIAITVVALALVVALILFIVFSIINRVV